LRRRGGREGLLLLKIWTFNKFCSVLVRKIEVSWVYPTLQFATSTSDQAWKEDLGRERLLLLFIGKNIVNDCNYNSYARATTRVSQCTVGVARGQNQ
jgi:hypothetical protein